MIRCDCEDCRRGDRMRFQGIAGTFQARLFGAEHRSADPSPVPSSAPIAATVADLPLFIGSLEPTLF